MATCAEANNATYQMRLNNQDYPSHRYEADYFVTVGHWQAHLACQGLYAGPVDGIWGPNSRKAVQTQVSGAKYGYTGPIDGVWGVNTWKGIQRMAADLGGYGGPIDGVPGPNTWLGIFGAFVPWN